MDIDKKEKGFRTLRNYGFRPRKINKIISMDSSLGYWKIKNSMIKTTTNAQKLGYEYEKNIKKK